MPNSINADETAANTRYLIPASIPIGLSRRYAIRAYSDKLSNSRARKNDAKCVLKTSVIDPSAASNRRT